MVNYMIDLHIHTTYSDGALTPSEIMEKARVMNINTLSFCDHNTIKLYKDLVFPDDLEIIKGVEFYASREGTHGLFHILAYDYNENGNFEAVLKYLDSKRRESMIFKLYHIKKNFGIDIPIEELDQTWLSEKNIREYLNMSYDDKFVSEVLDYVKSLKIKTTKKLDYRQIIDIVRAANGIPVLAHPKTIACGDFEYFLKDLVDKGLMGIEAYHSSHTESEIERYLYYAEKYNLLVSGGSDFHGSYHTNSLGKPVELGNSNVSGGIDDVSIIEYIRGRK